MHEMKMLGTQLSVTWLGKNGDSSLRLVEVWTTLVQDKQQR